MIEDYKSRVEKSQRIFKAQLQLSRDCIPVVIFPRLDEPNRPKEICLQLSKNSTMFKFQLMLSCKLGKDSTRSESYFIYVLHKGQEVSVSALQNIQQVYKKYRDEQDGILYMAYAKQQTLGN